MYTMEIDGYKFHIKREFNKTGTTVLSEVIDYILDNAMNNDKEETKENIEE